MEIKGISNEYYSSKENASKKVTEQGSEEQVKKAADKLELSAEAKKLSTEKKDQQVDLQAIRDKIDSKFYDQNAVIAKVADSILNSFR